MGSRQYSAVSALFLAVLSDNRTRYKEANNDPTSRVSCTSKLGRLPLPRKAGERSSTLWGICSERKRSPTTPRPDNARQLHVHGWPQPKPSRNSSDRRRGAIVDVVLLGRIAQILVDRHLWADQSEIAFAAFSCQLDDRPWHWSTSTLAPLHPPCTQRQLYHRRSYCG